MDHTRARHLRQIEPGASINIDLNQSPHSTALLSYGLVYGTVKIPERCWAPVNQIEAIVEKNDGDPLAVLRGEPRYRIGPDLAGLTTLHHAEAPPFHAVAVDFHWRPEVGETVFAVGYPELGFSAVSEEEVPRYLNEGMFGVYGTITNLFPQGRDRTHRTPVFEVEADWRSGMSGGPVFNKHGNVIGVVSYSLPPTEGVPGRGYATCLSFIPEAPNLARTLDADNPRYRRGFCIYNPDDWHLADITPSRAEAEQARAQLGTGYIVGWGSHRLGAQEFMLNTRDNTG